MMRVYFAWVYSDEMEFLVEHQREDERIYSLLMEHNEGEKPKLQIEIRNPRIGLLSPGRKIWAWLAIEDNSGHVNPIFFGRLLGVPTNIFGETCTLLFSADPIDFLAQKITLANTLKVLPYYDPVWVNLTDLDNPDPVLEGYSKLFHVDRTTLEVTVSDILVGEDGTIEFSESEIFNDSLNMSIAQAPLSSVKVDAGVSWVQRATGVIGLGSQTISSSSGNNLVTSWPKKGDQIGGGWSVWDASAVGQVNESGQLGGLWNLQMVTDAFSWQNKAGTHRPGDTMSVNYTYSHPKGIAPIPVMTGATVKSIKQVYAYISPFPDNLDQPNATINIEYEWDLPSIEASNPALAQQAVNTTLTLKYDAARDRNERILFTLNADLQPVFSNVSSPDGPPGDNPSYETISLTGNPVDQPIYNVEKWQANTEFAVGTLIRRNDEASYQVALNTGVSGSGDEPLFSDITGETTVDNSITWVCLGHTLPTTSYQSWQANKYYGTGSIIQNTDSTSLAISYQLALAPGTSGNGTISSTTGLPIVPPFGLDSGTITDETTVGDGGDISWVSLGQLSTFFAPPLLDVSRRTYFPTDRGLRSVENLIARARALLLFRSRVVEISFDCPIEKMFDISCRKNASITCDKLPGGNAIGKIVGYSISMNGDTGEVKGNVKIGCPVGNDSVVHTVDGEPTYIDDDYIEPDYQVYTDTELVLHPTGDVAYSVPIDGVNDDGLTFPLSNYQAVVFAGMVTTQAIPKNGPNPAVPSKTFYQLELKPVDNGPFSDIFTINCSTLAAPKGIDLEAHS